MLLLKKHPECMSHRHLPVTNEAPAGGGPDPARGAAERIRWRKRHERPYGFTSGVFWLLSLASALFLVFGCASTSEFRRATFQQQFSQKTGFSAANDTQGHFVLPAGVDTSDGLTRQECIALALANNATFQASLRKLDVLVGELLESKQFPNPLLSLLFPVNSKPLEATLSWPFHFLWQGPLRARIARMGLEEEARQLTARGMALIREVQRTLAEYQQRREEFRIWQEHVRLSRSMARIGFLQWKGGEISQMAWLSLQADSLRTENLARRAHLRLSQSAHQLKLLLGLPEQAPLPGIEPLQISPEPGLLPSPDSLLTLAWQKRPELQAARLRMEQAAARAGLASAELFQLEGLLDANVPRQGEKELGPGIQLAIPLLNWRGAQRAKAKAQLEQAIWEYAHRKRLVAKQVQDALSAYRTRQQAVEMWQKQLLPTVQEGVQRIQQAYQLGEASYLQVLETRRQLLEAELQQVQDLSRYWQALADLEFSVGAPLSNLWKKK